MTVPGHGPADRDPLRAARIFRDLVAYGLVADDKLVIEHIKILDSTKEVFPSLAALARRVIAMNPYLEPPSTELAMGERRDFGGLTAAAEDNPFAALLDGSATGSDWDPFGPKKEDSFAGLADRHAVSSAASKEDPFADSIADSATWTDWDPFGLEEDGPFAEFEDRHVSSAAAARDDPLAALLGDRAAGRERGPLGLEEVGESADGTAWDCSRSQEFLDSGPVPLRWMSDDTGGATGSAGFLAIAQNYHRYVQDVEPEEVGGKGLLRMKAALEVYVERRPDPIESLDERSGLLRNAEGPPVRDEESEEGDGTFEAATEELDALIAKVRGRLSRLPEDHQQIAIVTLILVKKELRKLLDQQKSKGSAARVMLTGGPAGYLEENILPVMLSHATASVKEFVPVSTGRKLRGKAAAIGEGALDIGWNAATLAADALTLGAASAGTAGIGGGYKGALAGASARRAGASPKKATVQAVVTFMLEFVQGLIPFYSGVAGIMGGGRAVYKAIDPAKTYTMSKGYRPLDDEEEDDGPQILRLLEPRIARGEALLRRADDFGDGPAVREGRGLIIDQLKFLKRQQRKSEERLG